MPFTVLTPLPASASSSSSLNDMASSSPHPSPGTRLNLHNGTAVSKAARDSIINSSAKGWSPLQINKRDSVSSPLRPSPNPSDDAGSSSTSTATGEGPRRTSSSFKHVTRNSLVMNSPFKNPSTVQGAQAAGIHVERSTEVIHERRSPGRALGQAASAAIGAPNTPKAAIGLGISAKPRSASRTPSGSAVSGTRKVSNERKVAFPSVSSRGSPGERKVSGSKENESPDIRHGKRTPRQSAAFRVLKQEALVSKSPFLSSKRVPSGGEPSPKTVPDDVFGSPSPSPRRVSPSTRKVSPGKRKASPGKIARMSDSHATPSPPRLFSNQIPGPSPLSRRSIDEPTPVATPSKSAMTPSRRLRGPRGAELTDTPSKSKTVTFQSIPDVKEFERMSVEGSVDGSFDVDHEHEHEADWVDDNVMRGGELEEILEDSNDIDPLNSALHDLRLSQPRDSNNPSPSEDDHSANHHDESTTADFVNTLIEEGLFSPPQMPTPAMDDQPSFEQEPDETPQLSTPSLGDPLHATPLFATLADVPKFEDNDEAGIPFGRTHHAERVALAHARPSIHQASPPPSTLPKGDNTMLLNANAAQPAVPHRQSPSAPLSHQDGPMQDPFITIQTATSAISPPRARDEGGVPLGRTSHAERILAARTLATQQLGLGMPGRNPSPAKAPLQPRARDEDAQSESGNEAPPPRGSSKGWEASNGSGGAETPKRGLPKPPAPRVEQVRLPSPVSRRAPEPEKKVEKRASKLDFSGFSLPFIGNVSPFFSSGNSVPDPVVPAPTDKSSPSVKSASSEEERPLTPPPPMVDRAKTESPHRIPSFEFEEISLTSVGPQGVQKATVTSNSISPIKASSSEEFGATRDPTAESTNTKVRQRISREMIRETINQRIADGSISRRGSRPTSMIEPPRQQDKGSRPASVIGKYSTSIEPPQLSVTPHASSYRDPFDSPAGDAAPSTARGNGVPMAKSLTTDAAPSREDKDPQQRLRGHKQSQSLSAPAHVVLRQNSKDGIITEPQSSLDRLAQGFVPDAASQKSGRSAESSAGSSRSAAMGPTASPFKPVSILKHATSAPASSSSSNSSKALPKAPKPGPNSGSGSSSSRAVEFPEPQPMFPPKGELMPPPTLSPPTPAPFRDDLMPDQNSVRSPAMSSVAEHGVAEREAAIPAKRKEKESMAVSAASAGSKGSRRSRRSVSLGGLDGDEVIEEEARGQGFVARGFRLMKQIKDFRNRQPRLTLGLGDQQSIAEAFSEEAANIGSNRAYKVKEKPKVHASFDRIAHSKAGDLDTGKAWRSLRRPSDINEHAAELRAMKAREASNGKASGTIFVKVLGIEGLQIPLPEQPTYFCVTLDNGIDYIRTPYTQLAEGAKVNQEFSLVEHPNFEFSLSLDIRRDPHILKSLHEINNRSASLANSSQASLATTVASPAKSSGGFRNLFGSPRKAKSSIATSLAASSKSSRSASSQPSAPVIAPQPPKDTIARYLATPQSSTIAKTHVAFKPVAKNCEARVLEIRYPMFAMFKGEPDRPGPHELPKVPNQPRKQLAKVTLQMFRLPPLPGVRPEDLPQCIDECLRGIRHHAWHTCEYHEGILTQEGGDCKIPRRRMFKLIGGTLVAQNEVTRKEVASIDLRKALQVVDLNPNASPKSRVTRVDDEEEGWVARPRSWRVVFADGEGIVFSADKEEDKVTWMQTLDGLIGKIPPNPLWAELLSEKMKERDAKEKDREGKRSTSRSSLAKEAMGEGKPRAASRAERA
ncbi:Bud site selection protein bud4 [Saitozyma podzolica]|uniref:Bud site selection protein bud4 n=1 Tax=Saitozyma podzolica TaxID=1890683 RepID=A0A427XVC1_9TREE|nr:Bud site selection protein bud4 [Saitozyma podzolica]